MKHRVLALICLMASTTLFAQQQTPHDLAFNFMRSGDFSNAILVLNKALQTDPENRQLLQDLAQSYFFKKDYAKAKEVAETLISRNDVDVISYQIAGNVYKALEEVKDAEKMYKRALKKYPESGPLYSEYGELLFAKEDFAGAIRTWEKGIEKAPSYPGNYYNAASYYFDTNEKVWAVIYGEIFANMEYLTDRGTQMRQKLLEAYRDKMFQDKIAGMEKNEFAKAVAETFEKQKALTGKGLTVEGLTMIRTKFIFDWFANYAKKYPYKLFDYHQQLIREGMFEAYNQWLFGSVDDLPAFEQWTKQNNPGFAKFSEFQKSRVFKMPADQYYQKIK
ncbi:MAG: tetratricopeptide repeat protein [Flavisolibacter sp.]